MPKHIRGRATTEQRSCAQPPSSGFLGGSAEIASDGVANARLCTHGLALCSPCSRADGWPVRATSCTGNHDTTAAAQGPLLGSAAISVSNQIDAMNLNRP